MGNARSASYSYQQNAGCSMDYDSMGSSYIRTDELYSPNFVRHRNIRLPRNQRDLASASLALSRQRSSSCSVMVCESSSRPEEGSSEEVTGIGSLRGRELCHGRVQPFRERTTPCESAITGKQVCVIPRLQHRAASCAALLQDHEDDLSNGNDSLHLTRKLSWKDSSVPDISTVGSPFRRHVRQFLSLRSYRGSGRRDCTARHSSSYAAVRPTTSTPYLSGLPLVDTSTLRLKMNSYLQDARQRKENVEQNLLSRIEAGLGWPSTADSQPHSITKSNKCRPDAAIPEFIDTEWQNPHQQTHYGTDDCNFAVGDYHRSHSIIDSSSKDSLEAQEQATEWTVDEQNSGTFSEATTASARASDNYSEASQLSFASYMTLITSNASGNASIFGPINYPSSEPSHASYWFDADSQHLPHYSISGDQSYGSTSGVFYLDCLRQILGKVPPYVEIRQGRLHLKLIKDDVMENIDGAIRVSEIADLLRAEYAVVTGGRSREGRPIVTFPDRCNFAALSEENYRKLTVYLASVPPLHDSDLGYVLIIDRRADRWNSVKATLLRISSFFPGLIAVVYVLRPLGLLQKAISEVSNKFFREDFKFRVVVCSSLEELHQRIDASQLTSELGGTLIYRHTEWIDTRISVESFSANTSDIAAALRKFSRRLQDTELPNDVQTTQTVLHQQSFEYASLKNELHNANAQGETLLHLIKSSTNSSGRKTAVSDPWPGQLVNITAVERLLIQIEETESTLDRFWQKHEAHLQLCLQLRQFELDFRELQATLDADISAVSQMANDGDSVIRIDGLLQETLRAKASNQDDLDRADALNSHAAKLMTEYAHSPTVLDSVRPKSVELQRMAQTLHALLDKRLETLNRARDLYARIEKANQWCSQGIDLLASQPLEKCSSPEFAVQALGDIEKFLSSASEFRLSDPKEFRSLFEDVMTQESKALIHQVIQRLQDVQVMCERRVMSLKPIVTRIRTARPVQSVPPEPAVPVPCIQARKSSTPDSTDLGSQIVANVKMGHVLTELLETERIYVSEINTILQGYRDKLVDPYQQVPLSLLEKADVLFGNLPEIGTFHGKVFLLDLENSLSSPQLVAKCFLRHSEDLHALYSFYCQNIPQSEELRRQVGEQNVFLRDCQMQLGHKLPLSAYLLKPVQRITKYQLLLKDMIKYSRSESLPQDAKKDADLQSALDAMLAVLRCVNDSMHQVAIVGYQGSLAELGRLLLQGGFSIWAEGKRDRLRELRLKPMQRHVFLYERGVVLCKRVGKDPDKATYHFKHLLKMSEVGLTETVHNGKGSDARKFELWLQGRQEVWVLQAPARDVKETWIAEIKRVLLSQFHQLKGQTMQNIRGGTGTSGKLSKQSVSIPNGTTASYGHKPLRPTSSWEYNAVTVGGGSSSSSSSSSGVSSTGGDRNSIIDSNSSTTGRNSSTGSRMPRSATIDEDDGWSTDFSLSDEEMGEPYLDHVEPLRRRYIALADYAPLGPTEAALKEGELVDLVRIGCAGWWYVRPSGSLSSSGQEGWAPSAYLEPAPNVKSPCSSGTPSVSSQDSEQDHCLT